MKNSHRLFGFATLLLVVAFISGCGETKSPPPGASSSTDTPEVDLSGSEETKKGLADETPEETTQDADDTVETKTADGNWATLTGRIVYGGTAPTFKAIEATKDVEVCGKQPIPDEELVVSKDGGIANAVVVLRTKGVQVAPSYGEAAKSVVLDNKGCRFEPHVQVVLTSQNVELKNSDPIGHNSKIDPLLNPGINPILPAGGEPVLYKFSAEEALPVKVGCNIHPWMGSWLVVRKDPYAAVTDADGKFTIKDLPAGKDLEFGLWQENSGYLKNATFKGGKADNRGRFKIKLKPGDNDLGDIKVAPSVFSKK
ncbi:MAG: hypothetical protein WD845_10345 [Pirellulales bacterium]